MLNYIKYGQTHYIEVRTTRIRNIQKCLQDKTERYTQLHTR